MVMLTGDSRTTAEAVARTLGIEHVEAEVLSEQKGDVVRSPGPGPCRRHGGGRHQRRPGPGAGARRHCYGYRHGRRWELA